MGVANKAYNTESRETRRAVGDRKGRGGGMKAGRNCGRQKGRGGGVKTGKNWKKRRYGRMGVANKAYHTGSRETRRAVGDRRDVAGG